MKSLFLVLLTTLPFFQPPLPHSYRDAAQMSEAEWQPSWSQARLEAEASDKPLLLLFAGSDWCRPCMQWDKEVFEQEAFTSWAKENVVLYKADFPRKKKNSEAELHFNLVSDLN